jgi:N-acyl homoserine lactone hydrolase
MIDGDHDVFGDGTVILNYAPGHTPGHQCLYGKLSKTGGVLVAGDLYHYAEERTLHRMPTREQTTARQHHVQNRGFRGEKRAQLWVGHSTSFLKDAIKSSGWYE